MAITKTYGPRAKNSCQTKTLDTEHMSKMRRFEEARATAVAHAREIEELQAKVQALEKRGRQTLQDSELELLLTMRDSIADLGRRKDKIESQIDEVSYFTETSSILYKYYDILENGTSTWFQTSNMGTPKVSTTNDRASLLDKYLSCTDFTHIRAAANCQEDTSSCSHCKGTSRTAMIQDGYMFCNACHTVEYILVDHDKPSYKDPPKEITYFAYKRINHFNEWLNTVQGKETTLIPDEMFDKILLELKKLRITNLSELSNAKMKDILKKLRPDGGSRYYEHIPHIITKLNGLPTPHLPPELEERLRHMFCQIQVPFLKHACALNPARKNFLSYSYVLNKFMQLLEKDQYLSSFPLLKTSGARVQEAMPVLVPCAA
ncbi:putative transcription factor [Tetrabaena socialis]|uniref:Putative transcription factor n=1 Tax=Tetrabaena socialis TaxID=47790 RepID=A0A2J7ZIX5_9CHLO|nr:putative transcription factor [Tetrabaena socialis]|eukprot:PNH00219.1 putative transcription factor [Tetrabaena socialis]